MHLPLKLVFLILPLCLTAQDPPKAEPPKPTHEQQLEKRVADLETFIQTLQRWWNEKSKLDSMRYAASDRTLQDACIGQPPQMPAAPKEPAK